MLLEIRNQYEWEMVELVWVFELAQFFVASKPGGMEMANHSSACHASFCSNHIFHIEIDRQRGVVEGNVECGC